MLYFCLTQLLPRTKSSVNQGVAVNRSDNKLVVIQNKDCIDDNLSFSENQYDITVFLFELRQPTSHPQQQLNKKMIPINCIKTIYNYHHTHI